MLTLFACGSAADAQDSRVSLPQLPEAADSSQTTAAQNIPTPPCVQPAPVLRLQDYNGPLKKAVGLFAERLERKSVRSPRYQPGVRLCSLDLGDKFVLFVRDTFDPVTFVTVSFDAGLDQSRNLDPSFGQGAAGYGKRFGASFVDHASFLFFKDFAYPTIFSEDPRYYRLDRGSGGRRLLHAVNHAFIAYRDSGKPMFNVSEWLGTTSAVVLSNTYHPGNARGAGPAAEQVAFDVMEDMGFDVLREFWPEISRKLRLPFRDEERPVPSPEPASERLPGT